MHGEGAAAAHGAAQSAEHAEHGSWIQFLYHYHIIPSTIPDAVAISVLTAIALGLAAFLMTRDLKLIPDKRQAALEMIVSGLQNFVVDLIGPEGKRYLPIVGTIFIYILVMNLEGLIPGWKSPTANLNVTATLAVSVFLYVQYEGIRANGFVGYVKHFLGEPLWLAPLNLIIHVVGELARPISLMFRLFGNIFGEDTVIAVLLGMGILTVGSLTIPIPLQAPLYFFAAFTSVVQALVFSILTCVYLASATVHEDHGGHEHGEVGTPTPDAEPHGALEHASPA